MYKPKRNQIHFLHFSCTDYKDTQEKVVDKMSTKVNVAHLQSENCSSTVFFFSVTRNNYLLTKYLGNSKYTTIFLVCWNFQGNVYLRQKTINLSPQWNIFYKFNANTTVVKL